jgi:hypothetical protein
VASVTPDDTSEGSSQREPLRSREVFLDTEIYRRLGFDTQHPSFASLESHIAEDRLALHLTDITRQEIARQLSQQAREAMDEVERARATLAKWRQRSPRILESIVPGDTIDGDAVAQEAVNSFEGQLRPFTFHEASNRSGADIFRAYFERRAPFDSRDGKSVKEFPDAFVLEALDAWCIENNTRMYVVTADQAMRRGASATSTLIPLATLNELLEAATIEHSPDVLETVEAILDQPEFAGQLAAALDNVIDELAAVYVGELYDGEVTGEAQRAGEPFVADWTVISAEEGSYGVVIEVVVDLLVPVSFQDLTMATYDREEGIYFGAEASETDVAEDSAELRMFVQILQDGAITREELLTTEIDIRGEVDWYK